jgi:ParB family chromosome partitioning protein
LLDLDDAVALADRVIRQGLSVRQTEALARTAKRDEAAGLRKPKGEAAKDADTRSLEADLEDVLGLKVEIRDRNGAGEMRIAYGTLEQLDDLCRRLSRPGGSD